MRHLILAMIALPLLISACGDSFYGAPEIPDQSDTLFSVGDESGYTGTYSVVLMEFDTDPSEESEASAVVTNVMRTIDAIDENGQPIIYKAKIANGTLRLNDDDTYKFTYRFENSSKQTIKIGKFSEGTENGEFTNFGNIIQFVPLDDTSSVLAPTETSDYAVREELGTIVLQAIKPSATGDYLTKVTLVKRGSRLDSGQVINLR